MENGDTKADQLEQRVKKLEDDVRDLTKKHNTLATKHDALTTKHDTLAAKHDALTTKHDALTTKHDTLFTKHDALAAEHNTLAAAHNTLVTKHDALAVEHDTLVTKHDALAQEVKDIKNPQSAAQIAESRLPQYRLFSLDELKAALPQERPDVLKEIAKRLNPENETDSQVLTNMFTFVEGEELMAELVTFAGTSKDSASGGTHNGQ